MQSGLVNDGAGEDGFAIVHQSDSQSIKPVRPLMVKMPLDDDLVDLLSNVFESHQQVFLWLSTHPWNPSRELHHLEAYDRYTKKIGISMPAWKIAGARRLSDFCIR